MRELVGLSDGGDVALELGDLVVETLLGLLLELLDVSLEVLLDPLAALGGGPILGIEGGDPGEGAVQGAKEGRRERERRNGGVRKRARRWAKEIEKEIGRAADTERRKRRASGSRASCRQSEVGGGQQA